MPSLLSSFHFTHQDHLFPRTKSPTPSRVRATRRCALHSRPKRRIANLTQSFAWGSSSRSSVCVCVGRLDLDRRQAWDSVEPTHRAGIAQHRHTPCKGHALLVLQAERKRLRCSFRLINGLPPGSTSETSQDLRAACDTNQACRTDLVNLGMVTRRRERRGGRKDVVSAFLESSKLPAPCTKKKSHDDSRNPKKISENQ